MVAGIAEIHQVRFLTLTGFRNLSGFNSTAAFNLLLFKSFILS